MVLVCGGVYRVSFSAGLRRLRTPGSFVKSIFLASSSSSGATVLRLSLSREHARLFLLLVFSAVVRSRRRERRRRLACLIDGGVGETHAKLHSRNARKPNQKAEEATHTNQRRRRAPRLSSPPESPSLKSSFSLSLSYLLLLPRPLERTPESALCLSVSVRSSLSVYLCLLAIYQYVSLDIFP